MRAGRAKNFIIIAFVVAAIAPLALHAEGDYKLKDGAMGEICLSCHDGMQETMDKPHVHSPLLDGDCIGCHNPHVSSHAMLMSSPPESICYSCHDAVIPEGAMSAHQVVAEGNCIACHDPHASDHEYNLVREGSSLCSECHQDLVTRIDENKYEHAPVREGCLGCHDAHSSGDNRSLLQSGAPKLCLDCHDTDKETFKKLHRNYPVEEADCTSCHDPHGSNTAAMLYDNVHDPVAKANCNRCHSGPDSSQPFELNAAGSETCQACHYEMITDTMNQSRVHWPFVDQKGCMNCHSPHASTEAKLMRQPLQELCASCHVDTVARQDRAKTKHLPIAEGQCGECHQPHGSDYQFILKEASTFDLCADCHEWQSHTTHPIGEEIIDPRNKNLSVQCESCHRTHGTEYNHFLYFATTNEQCVQCHARFRR